VNGLFGYPGALITLVRLQGIAELLLPFSVIVCSRGNVVYLQSQSVIEELLSTTTETLALRLAKSAMVAHGRCALIWDATLLTPVLT